MSRVAKQPIAMPSGVSFELNGGVATVKGKHGSLDVDVKPEISVEEKDNVLHVVYKDDKSAAMAGTTRSLLNNAAHGVNEQFIRKLTLVGVGYRAQIKGNVINLSLGFSHPVEHVLPEGITAETPSQTEILIKGIDKQLVGQVAADVRAYRPPEPYKGKGVRYADETVKIKETKK